MANDIDKDHIIAELSRLLVQVATPELEDMLVTPTAHLVKDLRLNGDDLSIFAAEAIKYFKVRPALADWEKVTTIAAAADLLAAQLAAGDTYEKWLATGPKRSLLARLLGPKY